MDYTANQIVAAVLGGTLSDEDHAAMVARFWDLFPQFEHMRDVVERIVAERRATASLIATKVLEIRDRRTAERDAVWDELFKTLLDGYDGGQEAKDRCDRRLERTKAWSKEIMDAEMVEIGAAYREDTDDFARCYRFLVWHHERATLQSMRPKAHCV
jgi:hypothetical protein